MSLLVYEAGTLPTFPAQCPSLGGARHENVVNKKADADSNLKTTSGWSLFLKRIG